MERLALASAFTLIALTLLGCAHTDAMSASTPITSATEQDIRDIGRRAVEDDGIVGLSIGVVIDIEIMLSDGFRHAYIDRTVPRTVESVDDVAAAGRSMQPAINPRSPRIRRERCVRASGPTVAIEPAHRTLASARRQALVIWVIGGSKSAMPDFADNNDNSLLQ
ncbi:MAG: hypothetical protein ACTS27_00515 [Phycisphaerales bacterium]